jgi:hypothetical protein
MWTLIIVVLFQVYRVVNEPLACCFVQALRSFEPWGSRDGAVMLG